MNFLLLFHALPYVLPCGDSNCLQNNQIVPGNERKINFKMTKCLVWFLLWMNNTFNLVGNVFNDTFKRTSFQRGFTRKNKKGFPPFSVRVGGM